MSFSRALTLSPAVFATEVIEEQDGYEIRNPGFGVRRWIKEETNQLHRVDGPAVESTSGDNYWYLNNQAHREDGPAIDWSSRKIWYRHGKIHREDGPAYQLADGSKRWYMDGVLVARMTDRLSAPGERVLFIIDNPTLWDKHFAGSFNETVYHQFPV